MTDDFKGTLTNFLPEFIEGNEFQLKTLTDIIGYHIHLVKFDTIVSDSAANGWNNIAGARKCEILIERFFANEELNTVFFHDHLFANMHQQHGMFGALIVKPLGAVFLDPETGEDLKRGIKAVIRTANGKSFREFAFSFTILLCCLINTASRSIRRTIPVLTTTRGL